MIKHFTHGLRFGSESVSPRFFIFITAILLASMIDNVQAQQVETFQIQGVVRMEDDNSLLEGVNVYLKNTSVGIATDRQGQFIFPARLKGGEVLVFSHLGLEKVEYIIPTNQPGPLEIRMRIDSFLITGAPAVEPAPVKSLRRNH